MRFWLVGKKCDDLLKKNTNLRERRWTNGEKEEIFTVPMEKNIIFGKKGGGAIISYLGTPAGCEAIKVFTKHLKVRPYQTQILRVSNKLLWLIVGILSPSIRT